MGCSNSTNISKPHSLRGLRLSILCSLASKNDSFFDLANIKKFEEILIEKSESFADVSHELFTCKASIDNNSRKCLDFFSSSNKLFLQLIKHKDRYEFLSNNSDTTINSSLKKKLWLVLRKNVLNDIDKYEIQENDIIRIGQFIFHVRDIHFNTTKKSPKKKEIKENCEFKNEHSCRVCLNNEETVENPLISPCFCKGSMKFIHLECAQKWFSGKYVSSSETDNVLIYSWTHSHCELCNQKMKLNYKIDGQNRNLMAITNKKKSYLLLESAFPDEKKKNYLIYIVLSSNEETIIGRNPLSHLKIDHLTVSKQHAKIYYENGKVFIEDLRSKFGTLILFRKNALWNSLPQRFAFQLKAKLLIFSNYY